MAQPVLQKGGRGLARGRAPPAAKQKKAPALRPAGHAKAGAAGRKAAPPPDRAAARQPTPPPPRRFLVGPALSVWQNSGDAPGPPSTSNWGRWSAPGARAWGGLRPAIMHGDAPGASCGFWDR